VVRARKENLETVCPVVPERPNLSSRVHVRVVIHGLKNKRAMDNVRILEIIHVCIVHPGVVKINLGRVRKLEINTLPEIYSAESFLFSEKVF